MKKGILFGGMGLALFAAGIFFFANYGTGKVSASEGDKNATVVKSQTAPTCGCNGASGASCDGTGKGCSANGGSCGCAANGGTCGQGKELRGASSVEKEAARAERKASCPCQKQ
jgi:hypothetical protein